MERHGHEESRSQTHSEQLRFLHSWFKSGARLTPFQRVLFTMLSLVLLGISGAMFYGLVDAIQTKGNVGASLAGFIGMGGPLLALAIFGLRNVLRFRK